MLHAGGFGRARRSTIDAPVELRFADLLLIIIATMMIVAVVLTITSAFGTSGDSNLTELSVSTVRVPQAVTATPYALTLAAEGGNGSYSWRLRAGSLPDGLGLSEDGVVSGTPSRQQQAQATVEVTDGQNLSAEQTLAFDVRTLAPGAEREATPLRVDAGLVVLRKGVSGQPYSHGFTAQQGEPPYTWSVDRGDLPDGLQLTDDGELTGRPESSGRTELTVEVTDGAGASASQRVRLEVTPAPRSLVRRAIGWLWAGVTFYAYFLVAVQILFALVGSPSSTGTEGLIRRFRRRRERERRSNGW